MTEITFHIEPVNFDKNKVFNIRITTTTPIHSKEGFIRAAATSLEKETLTFLLRYLSPSSLAVVPAARSLEILKLLAGTGKLFYSGKKVVVDLFGRVDFNYRLTTLQNGQFSLTGYCKLKSEVFELSSCDFVCPGPPCWFIKDYFLHFIKQDLSWKDIQKVLSKSSLSLQEQEKFIEDLSLIEENAPLLELVSDKCEATTQEINHPYPVLILHDRMGAFAHLMMDYGNGSQVPFHDFTITLTGNKLRQRKDEIAWEKDLLETSFIRKQVDFSYYYCPVDKVAKSLSFLLECGWRLLDHKGNQIKHSGVCDLTVNDFQNHLVVSGKLQFDTYEADIKNVLGAFNRRNRFIELSPGVVGLLPDQWKESPINDLIGEGEIVGDGIKIKKNRIGTLDSLWRHSLHIDKSLRDLKERLLNFKGIELALPGKKFCGELRPYQQLGVNWLNFLYTYGFHGILADDMGLGKTIQVLAFLSQLPNQSLPTLIVVPTTLIFNWQQEISRFLNISVTIFHGPHRIKDQELLQKSRFILTSYTTLRIDLEILSEIEFDSVILDEAQTIKNASTLSAQAVCQLKARFRLSLTGTPIENKLEELWSQFQFLMPDLLGNEENFAATIQTASIDSRHLQHIRKRISPFLLRRTKEEVGAELPECIEQIIFVEMGEEQRRLYDDYLAQSRSHLLQKVNMDGIAKHRIEILEIILRLRQLCCDPRLISSILPQESNIPSAKLDALLLDLEILREEGRKALIYSQFTSMLQLLTQAAKGRNWSYVILQGDTKNRESVVNQFQNDPLLSFFFISLKAGGAGLNLTAADAVFLYDPWWNEAVEKQAIGRAHRIGRKEPVTAKKYLIVNTIEEKMLKLKQTKSKLVDSLLEGEGIGASLTSEDLAYLLS